MEELVVESEERTAVQIRLFGGVGATDDDSSPVDVGPAKCQTLLAALALSVGETVSMSRLVDLVWGDESPRTAERTLQSYVARVRRGLGQDSIVRSGGAYRLALDRDDVDTARFQRHLEMGDVEAALEENLSPAGRREQLVHNPSARDEHRPTPEPRPSTHEPKHRDGEIQPIIDAIPIGGKDHSQCGAVDRQQEPTKASQIERVQVVGQARSGRHQGHNDAIKHNRTGLTPRRSERCPEPSDRASG